MTPIISARGLTKRYGRDRLDRTDVYASVSKPVTSMIVLQLRQQGKIRSLDDDIGTNARKYFGLSGNRRTADTNGQIRIQRHPPRPINNAADHILIFITARQGQQVVT